MSTSVATEQRQFTAPMRLFHWLTAAMVLTMLGIGVAMVASLAYYHRLVSIHRPLGILILIVVVIRFVNRHYSTLPPFPATMSPRERSVASASELFLYALLVVQPLVGWGMLSAARYPIMMYRVDSPLPHTSPQRDVVRSVAQGPHGIGLPLVPGVPRPFWGRFVSHVGPARWNLQPYGAVESSYAVVNCFGHSLP